MQFEVIKIYQKKLAYVLIRDFLQGRKFTHHVVWDALVVFIDSSSFYSIILSINSADPMVASTFSTSTLLFDEFEGIEIEASIWKNMR